MLLNLPVAPRPLPPSPSQHALTHPCWQLGLGHLLNATVPMEVTALRGKDVARLAAGGGHSLVLERGGALWGFGSDRYGQLGLREAAGGGGGGGGSSSQGGRRSSVGSGAGERSELWQRRERSQSQSQPQAFAQPAPALMTFALFRRGEP